MSREGPRGAERSREGPRGAERGISERGISERGAGRGISESGYEQVLVVVPMSTLGNWKREFRTWGCFRLAVCHGAEKEAALRALASRECEVVLTTYETVVNCQRDLAGHPWEATVWDEAHKLKNPKAKVTESAQRVACPSRFALTGARLAAETSRD